MIRAFMSEWVKLGRPFFILAGAGSIVGFTVISTAILFQAAATEAGEKRGPFAGVPRPAELAKADGLVAGLDFGATFIGLVALAIFATNVAQEFERGTIRLLLVAEPRRLVVLGGKFVALASFLTLAVGAATLVTIAAAFALAPAQDISTDAWTSTDAIPEALSAFVNAAIATIVWGLIGGALAMVTRSAAPAISIGVGFLLIFENLVGNVSEAATEWLPASVLSDFTRGGTPAVSYETAAILVTIYGAACISASALIFTRRDVTD